ncbi:MAG: hypothetical protein HXX20_17745, partial [Chloroflexi bacterium]|nr:hypothetical protein [Chloroflexota bacterium]
MGFLIPIWTHRDWEHRDWEHRDWEHRDWKSLLQMVETSGLEIPPTDGGNIGIGNPSY